MINPGQIFEAILQVRKSVESIQKTGENTSQKYNYATSNEVIGKVREACNEAWHCYYSS